MYNMDDGEFLLFASQAILIVVWPFVKKWTWPLMFKFNTDDGRFLLLDYHSILIVVQLLGVWKQFQSFYLQFHRVKRRNQNCFSHVKFKIQLKNQNVKSKSNSKIIGKINKPPKKKKKPNQCHMLKVDTDWLGNVLHLGTEESSPK